MNAVSSHAQGSASPVLSAGMSRGVSIPPKCSMFYHAIDQWDAVAPLATTVLFPCPVEQTAVEQCLRNCLQCQNTAHPPHSLIPMLGTHSSVLSLTLELSSPWALCAFSLSSTKLAQIWNLDSPAAESLSLLSTPSSSAIKRQFPVKGQEWNEKFLPQSTYWYTAAAILQPAKEQEGKLHPRHWEIAVRCLSLHNFLLQVRLTSHCQDREDVPWRLDLIETQFVSWVSRIP